MEAMKVNSNEDAEQRLSVFLNETLPEVNKILEEYRKECNERSASKLNSDAQSVQPTASKRTVEKANRRSETSSNNTTSSSIGITSVSNTTPMISSSSSTRTAIANNNYNNGGGSVQSGGGAKRLRSLSTSSSAASFSSVDSLESQFFMENIGSMLNNIRDYAEYVSDRPQQRGQLLRKVHALLRECYAISSNNGMYVPGGYLGGSFDGSTSCSTYSPVSSSIGTSSAMNSSNSSGPPTVPRQIKPVRRPRKKADAAGGGTARKSGDVVVVKVDDLN